MSVYSPFFPLRGMLPQGCLWSNWHSFNCAAASLLLAPRTSRYFLTASSYSVIAMPRRTASASIISRPRSTAIALAHFSARCDGRLPRAFVWLSISWAASAVIWNVPLRIALSINILVSFAPSPHSFDVNATCGLRSSSFSGSRMKMKRSSMPSAPNANVDQRSWKFFGVVHATNVAVYELGSSENCLLLSFVLFWNFPCSYSDSKWDFILLDSMPALSANNLNSSKNSTPFLQFVFCISMPKPSVEPTVHTTDLPSAVFNEESPLVSKPTSSKYAITSSTELDLLAWPLAPIGTKTMP